MRSKNKSPAGAQRESRRWGKAALSPWARFWEGLTSLSSGEDTQCQAEPAAIASVAVKGTVCRVLRSTASGVPDSLPVTWGSWAAQPLLHL